MVQEPNVDGFQEELLKTQAIPAPERIGRLSQYLEFLSEPDPISQLGYLSRGMRIEKRQIKEAETKIQDRLLGQANPYFSAHWTALRLI